MENYPTKPGDEPVDPIVIVDCGVLALDDPSLAEESAAGADGDIYEDYPDDDDRDTENPQVALDIAKNIREVANKLFKAGKVDVAFEKYQSMSSTFALWLS